MQGPYLPAPQPAKPVANVIVPPNALVPWQTALANSGTSPAIAWTSGASTSQGGSAPSNIITKSTFGQWRQQKINQGYTTGGDFFLSTYSAAWSSNNAPNGWPFQCGTGGGIAPAAWANAGPWWVPQYNATAVTLATPQIQYTHPSTDLGYNARSFRVYYMDLGTDDGGGSGAGFTWKWNTSASEVGATVVTLVGGAGGNLVRSFDITGLANSAGNTIMMGNQSNAAAMLIIGVLACPGTTIATSGVFYCRMGSPGFCMGDFMSTNQHYPADKLSRYIGPAGAVAPFAPNAALSPIFAPDLAIIEPFDDVAYVPPGTLTLAGVAPATAVIHGVPADVYKWGLDRMVYAFRRKSTGCTIVHELPNIPDGYVSDTSVAANYVTQNWGDYYDAHIAIANRYGNQIVSNTNANWGELGVTYAYLTASNAHPNDAGAGTAAPTGSPSAALNIQARTTRWVNIGL